MPSREYEDILVLLNSLPDTSGLTFGMDKLPYSSSKERLREVLPKFTANCG